MNTNYKTRLKSLRNKQNLTTKELAEILNIGTGTVNSYENGKTSPSIDKVILYSEYFNVSTNWIITGEDYINEKTITTDELELLKLYNNANNTAKTICVNALKDNQKSNDSERSSTSKIG